MTKNDALIAISNLIDDTNYEYLCKKFLGGYASDEEWETLFHVLKENQKFSEFTKIVGEYLQS